MIMKDKLKKHHHKASYFVAQRIAFVFLFAIGLSITVAVPTYILSTNNVSNAGHAEEQISEVSETSSEEVEQY